MLPLSSIPNEEVSWSVLPGKCCSHSHLLSGWSSPEGAWSDSATVMRKMVVDKGQAQSGMLKWPSQPLLQLSGPGFA